MANWRIRVAVAEDVPDILRMIKDLALYEKEPESRVNNTEKALLRDGFGETPWFGCVIAEELQCSEENCSFPKKRAVGYSFFHHIYSPWDGRALYMEDLYVEPAFRGKGIGTALLKKVSAIALERECVRVDWNVKHWNKVAADFYKNHGAVCLDEWRLFRLTRQRLLELAGKKPEQ